MAKRWPPPGFPIVEGKQQLTDDWSIELPAQFARRIDNGSLVFWRPGFTVWMDAWGSSEEGVSREERIEELKAEADPEARVVRDSDDGTTARFAYRIRDLTPDGPMEAVTAFAATDAGHLQVGIYFDDIEDEENALELFDSIRFTGYGSL